MKIAHLLPASAVFPLAKHNGRYEWALRLARLQVSAGHEVTIFAGHGSSDGSPIQWRSIDSDETSKDARNIQLVTSALQDTTFHVFHSHFDSLGFSLAGLTSQPVITTQHWFPTTEIAKKIRSSTARNAIAVPVTYHMQEEDKRLGIPASQTIYHGIDLALFKQDTSKPRGERLLYTGRIAPHKGVAEIVALAKQHGAPIDIVGKINDVDQPYWQQIAPHVDGQVIRYLGTKNQQEMVELYASAKALLFLPNSIEAFGQTLIEAQACGTPVITNDLGANGELVDHGRTGYVLHNKQSTLGAIDALNRIKSSDCVDWARQFNIHKMTQQYDSLYHQLLAKV